MKRAILVVLALSISATAFSQESGVGRRRVARQGEAAGYASRDATTLSMMGWGLGLAIGFAAICALIENDSTSSSGHTTTSGSSSGGGGTSH